MDFLYDDIFLLGVCVLSPFCIINNINYQLTSPLLYTSHEEINSLFFFSISGLRCRSIFAIQKSENEIFVLNITKNMKKRSHNPVILNCPFLSSVFFLIFFS